jgi:sec-independent protein translocase protein TatB
MPSLPDTAVIILLGLLLFGPKGLAQIARQLGKLMGEFRRASNEFRMQMEEELRIAEQADRQKEIAKIEAAAPAMSRLPTEVTEELPQLALADSVITEETVAVPEPQPIASSGDLSIIPPATGLPEPRSSSLASLIDSVPKMDPPHPAINGAATNGDSTTAHLAPHLAPHLGEDQRPMRYTDHDASNVTGRQIAPEESLHG